MHNTERQQPLPGRAGFDLGVHRRAYAAFEARGPPAVLDFFGASWIDCRKPVLPEPVTLQAGVQMIPRQDLVVAAFPGGVPVKVNAVGRKREGRALLPPLERERLAPPVEPATVLPDSPDDLPDPAVAAR